MSFGKRAMRQRGFRGSPGLGCPMCSAQLDAGAIPRNSIVLCASCYTPLLWDGAYSIATREELAALSEQDRATLESLLRQVGAQLEGPPRCVN